MKSLLLIVCICLLFPAAGFPQSPFLVMTEILPPFSYRQDDRVVGISTDLVRSVFAGAGYPLGTADVKVLPWPRAYRMVQEVPGTVLFSMARTPQREEMFHWVGPLYQITIGLLAKKSRQVRIDSFADLADYRIGTVRDGAPEQLLVKAGVAVDRLERVSHPEMNIKKLCSDRIDLFPFNVQTAQYLMLELGEDPNDFETVYLLKQPLLYIALHKQTDPRIVTALQQAFDRLRQPGSNGKSRYDVIVEKYLGAR